MRSNKYKYIILVILLFVIFIPLLQNIFNIFQEKELKGVPYPIKLPEITSETWFNGQFQSEFDKAANENVGLRNFLIRTKNQIDYSLLNKSNAPGVIVGKNKTLYEWDYIRAFIGRDFIGKEAIKEKMNRTLFIQNEYKKKNINLVLVFEPGKASLYPENIPKRFKPGKKNLTNYEYMKYCADSLDIDYLDLNQYFVELRDTVSVPLIPRDGIHWSVYGMNLAVDTIVGFIENLRGIDMPDKVYYRIDKTKIPRSTDNDLVGIMNLIKPSEPEYLGYPVFEYVDGIKKTKPNIKCIGDSFFWNLFSSQIPKKVFAYTDFMYYYKSTRVKEYDTVNTDTLSREETPDVILIMITERFLYKYAWGYIDDTYQLLSGKMDEFMGQYYYENRIRQDYVWFDRLVIEATDRGINLVDHIRGNADYMVYTDVQNRSKNPDLKYYIDEIRNDSAWLEDVRRKAIENNISLDSMIRLDAEWVLNNSDPSK